MALLWPWMLVERAAPACSMVADGAAQAGSWMSAGYVRGLELRVELTSSYALAPTCLQLAAITLVRARAISSAQLQQQSVHCVPLYLLL
jgi:hypothetical protein